MIDHISSKERMSYFHKRNYIIETVGSIIIFGLIFISLIQITNI